MTFFVKQREYLLNGQFFTITLIDHLCDNKDEQYALPKNFTGVHNVLHFTGVQTVLYSYGCIEHVVHLCVYKIYRIFTDVYSVKPL